MTTRRVAIGSCGAPASAEKRARMASCTRTVEMCSVVPFAGLTVRGSAMDIVRGRQRTNRGVGGGKCARRTVVGLTVKRFTRAARALVATAARHAACPHLKRAMQAA